MLLEMHELTRTLIKKREERGAIDFDLPEAELWFNDEGQIGGIARSERNIAHRLIEEFMLLANETVATHLASLNVPLLYRIHEEPNIEKVEEYAEIAAALEHCDGAYAEYVRIAAKSGVMRDVPAGVTVGGFPAMEIRQWHRQTTGLGRLLRPQSNGGS